MLIKVLKCASKGCQISDLWWYWCFYSFDTSVTDSRTESANNNGISKQGQSNTRYCASRVRMWHSRKLFWIWKGHRYQTSEIGICPFYHRKCRFPILRCDSPSNFFFISVCNGIKEKFMHRSIHKTIHLFIPPSNYESIHQSIYMYLSEKA